MNLANSEDYGQATQMLSFWHMLQTGGVAGWSLHAQIETWDMLNSAEHGILNAHMCKMSRNSVFYAQISLKSYFPCP